MAKQRLSVESFIAHGKSPGPAGTIIEFDEFYTGSGVGGGRWRKTGNTGTASQYPSDLIDIKLIDSSGTEWEIITDSKLITPESLGGGTSDDSNIFAAMVNSGLTILCQDKTYYAEGVQVPSGAKIYGNDCTIVSPVGGSASYIFRASGGMFVARDVTFSCANTSVGCNAVLVVGGGIQATNCKFNDAKKVSGFGEGLNISASTLSSSLTKVKAVGNESTGISVLQSPTLSITETEVYSNGGGGISINNYDLTLTKKIANVTLTDVITRNNTGTGLALGNPYNDNDFSGDNFGFDNGVCTDVTMSGIISYGNTVYGCVLSMVRGVVSDIITRANDFGGLLVNGRYIEINNPQVTNNPNFGIDIGQGEDITINGGRVAYNSTDGGAPLLLEACKNVLVDGTQVHDNGNGTSTNIRINAIGGTGDGRYFSKKAENIVLRCDVKTTFNNYGLLVCDNPIGIIDENTYKGGSALLFTRIAAARSNIESSKANAANMTWLDNSAGDSVVPDVVSSVLFNTTNAIDSVRPYSFDFFDGKVSYIDMTASGSGYTVGGTSVSISGDGTGATATPVINAGTIVGIKMDTFGSGYTSATVTITGDGSGASATAIIGGPLVRNKKLTLFHNQAQTINKSGSPSLVSPTAGALSAPAAGATTLSERYGQWIVESSNYSV